MRFLTLEELLEIYREVMDRWGGCRGIRDRGALESALTQPHMTFAGQELYPGLVEKAAVLGFALLKNHPFVDGNKRTAHAAIEVFLMVNGYEIEAPIEEQELVILEVASGQRNREAFTEWLRAHVVPLKEEQE